MINFEREISALQATAATYQGLRNLRSAAIENISYKVPPDSDICQVLIQDAEILASTCAEYVVDGFQEYVSSQRERWAFNARRIFQRHAFPRLSPQSPGDYMESYVGLLEGMSGDPLKASNLKDLRETILRLNHANFSIADLPDEGLLVLSPLSTDYLMSAFLQRYTQRFLAHTSFKLKPLILNERYSTFKRPVCVPNFRDGSYNGIKRVEVFVNNSTSFETMDTTREAVRNFWPTSN